MKRSPLMSLASCALSALLIFQLGLIAPAQAAWAEKPETSDAAAVEADATAAETDEALAAKQNWANEAYAHSWRFGKGEPRSATTRSTGVTWEEADGVYIASDGTQVNGAKAIGIDVSRWQGEIDWQKVKAAGIDFAIIRCGYGSTEDPNDISQDDEYFFANVEGAKAAGIEMGIYIYSYACGTKDAKDEANHVLRLLNAAGITPDDLAYPVYLDFEQESWVDGRPCGIDAVGREVILDNEDLAEMATVFCDTISAAGFEPGVYANLKWWTTWLNDGVFNSWSRWVAHWAETCGYAGNYDLWQRMSTGSVDGIQGGVDINFVYEKKAAGLSQDENGLRWINEDGTALTDSFKTVDGTTYYFGSDGYALADKQWIGGKLYYFNADYSLYTGWMTWKEGNSKSYFSPKNGGAAAKGWWTIDGKRYWFDSSRKAEPSVFKSIRGKIYYFGSNCNALRYSQRIGGKLYYFNSDYSMHTGWLAWSADGRKSYFSSKHSGAAVKGWWTIGGKKYYFDPSNCKTVRYSKKIGQNWYYFSKAGVMYKGWLKWSADGKWSYFDKNGVRAFGKKIINGVKYDFGTSGKITDAEYRRKAGK